MIVSNIIGGLGNQMFQFSAGKALSLRLGVKHKLDIRDFSGYLLHQGFELGRIFNCNVEVSTETDLLEMLSWQRSKLAQRIFRRPQFKLFKKKSLVVEPCFQYWIGINQLQDNQYLYGYWQSEKYFIDFEKEIRNDLSFKLPLSIKNSDIAKQISNVNSVSIHVRRGDYVSNVKNAFIGTCSLDYYRTAIERIKTLVKNPTFFIFSDDVAWVKDNLILEKKSVYINNNLGKDSYNDMHLMSLCQHNVIANSSFSWWGAWLNSNPNKIVIAPKKWFADDRPSYDLIPDSWLKL